MTANQQHARWGWTAAILLLLATPARAAPDPAIAAAENAIETAIVPAVIVTGEPVAVTSLAERLKTLGVPGVGIAVIRDGRIAWARGYGSVTPGGRPVDTDTLFQAASISKAVAAGAVMRLVAAGRLDLDRPVNNYLKSWQLPVSPLTADKPVTIRRLLSHTAGTNVHGFAGYAGGAPVPTLMQILKGEKPANSDAIKVETVPGTAWAYSGGGFVILQQLLADVTHQPVPALLAAEVLKPAGMVHSSYTQPATPAMLANAALAHDDKGSPLPGGPHTYPELLAAGLWTTPADLARYAIALQAALAGRPGGLMPAATAKAMLAPGGKGDWGLGIAVGGSADHRWFSHTGGNEGYRCIMLAYEHGDGVIVMTNGDRGAEVMNAVVRTIAATYNWPDFKPLQRTAVTLNPAVLNRFVGQYRIAAGAVVTFTRDGDHLVAALPGRPPAAISADGPDSFFWRDDNISVRFASDASGKVTGMVAMVGTSQMPAQRLP